MPASSVKTILIVILAALSLAVACSGGGGGTTTTSAKSGDWVDSNNDGICDNYPNSSHWRGGWR